ncbi:hypothetical protein DES53_104260 [Roseimicrobium gellanilyticum]|uniref:Uncharacterized protein n=1 Tax=Roseimicrobium gellanilyticum TaxID=748857 RepID=A0A366HPQ0_9BACT|nr:hypothetical protein [Roseimicrobium gellanilyticum]RBP44440.1 hypothetical protein DES53_104260 [Roseimicrobium gellanilyticum]
MVLSAALSLRAPLTANPIAITHDVYIASEALHVKVDAEAAHIDGSFRFKSALKKGDFGEDSDVFISIPVWIPAKASQGDATVASLLKTLESADDHYKLEGPLRQAWSEAIGLKLTIGNRDVPIGNLRVSNPMSRSKRKYTSAAWRHEGWILSFADVGFSPALLRGSPEVHIRYRQPLRKTKAGAEFLYLPEFHDLPEGSTTKDLEKFAMKLQAQQGVSLAMGGVIIPAGHSARLPLSHQQPIKLLVTTP